jgi:transcriptional repressor NrdR
VVRRRRECLSCNYRFTTYEEIEREDLRVIKRDGRYEPFDRRKIVMGFLKACEKRPVSPELIDKTADKMIEDLEQKYGREIPTTAVGEKIMEALKKMDEVAYVRFASVYKEFRDVSEFTQEINTLGPKPPEGSV